MHQCTPLVLCGPSGAGKSTLISKLMAEFPDDFGFSVSHTTRAPRAGEVHGVNYFFAEKGEMTAAIAAGKFLETAAVHGNLYGTSYAAVRAVTLAKRICILDIDVQGVNTYRGAGYPGVFVFIAPPTLEALEARLRKRGTEDESKIRLRVDGAVKELDASKGMAWDAYVVNDVLDTAYAQLREAATAARERCARARATGA